MWTSAGWCLVGVLYGGCAGLAGSSDWRVVCLSAFAGVLFVTISRKTIA